MERSPRPAHPQRPLETDRRRDLALGRRLAPNLPLFGQLEPRR